MLACLCKFFPRIGALRLEGPSTVETRPVEHGSLRLEAPLPTVEARGVEQETLRLRGTSPLCNRAG